MSELVNVTALAKEVGFNYPVSLSPATYQLYCDWNKSDNLTQPKQTIESRIYNILSMLYISFKNPFLDRGPELNNLRFALFAIPRDGVCQKAKRVNLQAVIFDTEDDNQTVTIMLPDEL